MISKKKQPCRFYTPRLTGHVQNFLAFHLVSIRLKKQTTFVGGQRCRALKGELMTSVNLGMSLKGMIHEGLGTQVYSMRYFS